MKHFTLGHVAAILALGLLGWALCGAIMFIGMSVISLQTTLIIHAVGAPIIFGVISWFYFSRLNYSTPLSTAIAFLLIVMAMDFFLVALVINRSLDMFQGLLGTWIPFALIFLSTYMTGLVIQSRSGAPDSAA
jgi:hypothetical protein